MTYPIQYKASIISAVTEVMITHPIDYVKTVIQNSSEKQNIKKLIKTPYKGVSSRLVGIVPMRLLFWNSIDYFNSKGLTPIQAGVATSIVQTSIDYPIELIKTQKINNNKAWIESFRGIKLIPSVTSHLLRNMGFAVFVNGIIQKNPDSLYYGAIGGLTGSLITQPLDSLKTWYQSGNKTYPKNWKFNDYMKGGSHRCLVSLLSMNIGWVIYHRLKE